MNITLSLRMIIFFIVSLVLACTAMIVSFNLIMADGFSSPQMWKTLLGGLAVVVPIGAIGAVLINSWLSPIRKCVIFAEAISAGHEDAKLEVYRTD